MEKEDDTLELPAHEQPVTKRTILSYLGTVYDPLGIISPTMAEQITSIAKPVKEGLECRCFYSFKKPMVQVDKAA